jgi:murein DD-endopeptidase MepM/ murein hydrolase activator NlpD
MARHRAPIVAALALIFAAVPPASAPAVSAAAAAAYSLPASAGTQLIVTQGQDTPLDHNKVNHSVYAIDFGIAGDAEFDVTAARAGTVIGVRDSSTANCYNGGKDWSCWKDANYVLVDHHDGTSALYVHLATGSAAVKLGDRVSAGQKLAKDDNTGFSSGNHLHFMVETTPTVPTTPPPGPTDKTSVAWWWTDSQPVTFSDPDVLRQDPDGIPKTGQTVTSGAPAPTPPTVISGTWVAPKDGAKLTTSTLTLSAKPTVAPSTLHIAKVAFSIKWGTTTKAACSATKAGAGGVWSCKVDLWELGAPLGKLTVSFDATDSAGDAAKAPAGTRTVTLAAPPPAPASLREKQLSTCFGGGIDCQFSDTWAASPDKSSHVEVYWVIADPLGDYNVDPVTFNSLGPVSCSAALTMLTRWLKKPVPDAMYYGGYQVATSKAGATKVLYTKGFGTDYQGQGCGSWARAVNRFGSSPLVRIAGSYTY